MRILHLCLSNFYVDGFAYQENELVQQNIRDGHIVEVIASTEVIGADGKLNFVSPGRYLGSDGAMVERLPYRRIAPRRIMAKLRMHPRVEEKIAQFAPDVILFHCACGWELNAVGRYVRINPHVRLYVDCHSDFINSARGILSKWLLHWSYYRPILRRNLKYVTKVLPVATSALEFMRDFYGVPTEKLELYPLGGFVADDAEYARSREQKRRELKLADADILIVQSGKLDGSKKLLEALTAFRMTTDIALHFVVAGRILPDIEHAVRAQVASDPRIRLLGWQSPDDLRTLLCAADVYCQPGTQSATMQMSLANRCAVILDDIPSHHPYMDDNGWLVGPNCSLEQIFFTIPNDKAGLHHKGHRSYEVALRMLDYRLLAARLYRNH
jgi:1,2-diacylglycerol 3-alpha-glucosyltransferase